MTTTYPLTSKQWVVTHIPNDFTPLCPNDFDEDRFLEQVLMAVNLSNYPYQIDDAVEMLAESFIGYVGSDDVTEDEEEYGWRLAEFAVENAKALFPYVKPALRSLENEDGFGVDVRDVYLDPMSMMFVVEAI